MATNGNWSLVNYRGTDHEGTIYGDVVGGNVLLSDDGGASSKSTRLNLCVKGGTGSFSGKDVRNTSFSLESVTDVRLHQTSGNAFLPF